MIDYNFVKLEIKDTKPDFKGKIIRKGECEISGELDHIFPFILYAKQIEDPDSDDPEYELTGFEIQLDDEEDSVLYFKENQRLDDLI